jgi:YVTN family beta-propeller protein
MAWARAFVRLLVFAIVGVAAAMPAFAVPTPITYSFSGTASGTLNGATFTNAAITINAVGDAGAVVPGGISCNSLYGVSFTISGVGAGMVSDPLAIFANGPAVGLERVPCAGGPDWVDINTGALSGYGLTGAIGPVTGTPLVQGTVNTTIGSIVFSNSSAITTFQASMTGVLPVVNLTTAFLPFGPQLVGTTSPPLAVTVTNTGTADLNFISLSISPNFAKTTTCPPALVPGAGCSIVVNFVPTSPGNLSGVLIIKTDAPGSPHQVVLTGLGIAPSPPAGPFAYISNQGSGTVSVIDTPTRAVVATIAVGASPTGVAVNPAFTRVYVANYGSGTVSVIDTFTNAVVTTIPVGGQTNGIAVDGTGSRVYVTSQNLNQVSVIDTGSNAVIGSVAVGSLPQTVAVNPAMSRAYVVNAGSNCVSVIDTVANAIVATVPVGGNPIAVAVNPSGTRAYVTNFYDSSVSVIDTATNAVVATIAVGSTPVGITVDPSGSRAYTANQYAGTVSVIDTGTNTAIATVGVGSFPVGVDVTPDGAQVFVANSGNGTVSVISSATNTLTVAVAVGSGPQALGHFIATPASLAPTITLTPASLTFAARTIASTSTGQTVTVAANGSSVAITSITINGDFAFTSSCPPTLAAGATCDIAVTFTPLAIGARTGSLTLATSATGSPHALALSGTGQAALVPGILAPATLDFVAQTVGTESGLEFATLTNDGTAPLVFSAIAVSGDFASTLAFTSSHGPCVLPLAPGASCEIGVAFRPSASGLREGTLQIDSNAASSPTLIQLVGTGLDAVPARALTVPASLAFAMQRMGTRSAGLPLDVVNNLATAATITELSATGDFTVSDTCTTIAPRGHCTPLVSFRPTALGDRNGALTIRTLSDTLPYLVTLSGAGLVNPLPSLGLSVTRVGFGNLFLGSANTVDVVLSNLGQVPVVFASFYLSGDYLVSNTCGATLAVGATCTVQVTFSPTTPGVRSGALEIRSNAEGSPHTVEFSGVGCTMPSMTRARLGTMRCGS